MNNRFVHIFLSVSIGGDGDREDPVKEGGACRRHRVANGGQSPDV